MGQFTIEALPVPTGGVTVIPGASPPGTRYVDLPDPTPEQMAADAAAIQARQRGQVLPPSDTSPIGVPSFVAPAQAAEPASQFTVEKLPALMPDQIDQRTGAPAFVRHAVGGAPENDRLATLQKYYPDAQPYGEKNFVFTDPKTGAPTLYNPKGFDFGDVASVLPEMAEFGGGMVGGALTAIPATAAAPATGGASYLSVPVGYGLGAAAGREFENMVASLLTRRQDTRGLPQHLTDTATTAGVNAVGGRIGELASQGVRSVFGPVASYTSRLIGNGRQALADFANAGVTPSAGAVTGNRGMQMVEKGLSNMPGSASIMQRQADTQIAEIQAAAEDLARRFGPVQSKQGTGEALQRSARNAGQRFANRREALDQAVENVIGPHTPTQVLNSQQLLTQLVAQRSQARASRTPELGPAIERLTALMSDAANQGGTIPFAALRSIRTALGRDLERPDISGYNPASEAALRRAYGAISEDIRAAARIAGPDAERALATHDRYVRFHRAERLGGGDAPLARLQRLEDAGSGEQAFNYAMGLAKDGGSRLAALRRSMPPEDWDVVAGTALSRLGRATPGNQGATALGQEAGDFSVSTFLTNWNKLSTEAKTALFAGTRYRGLAPELDQLVRVATRLKDADKMANPSGTARNLFIGLGVLEAGRDLFHGEPKSAAGKVAFAVVAPRYAARLITSPAFVNWLAQSATAVAANPHGMATQLIRLAGIAEAEPEIRESVAQYIAALRGLEDARSSAAPAR